MSLSVEQDYRIAEKLLVDIAKTFDKAGDILDADLSYKEAAKMLRVELVPRIEALALVMERIAEHEEKANGSS